jgi:CDP-paratose 2-epimerase
VKYPELISGFEDNTVGTFNVLEAARLSGRSPIVLYASTNKVYGGMDDLKIVEKDTRYTYADLPNGVPESSPLDFHSPYGCSKGTGDQYIRDYARIYDLPAVVFRQSTIYGPRQFGVEDQGYLSWFVIAAVLGKPITIYGDGK